MKDIRLKALCISAFIFQAAIFTAACAADTNSPPRLTVELQDGSRLVGVSVGKIFEFQSALLGKIKLAVKDIRSVECVSTNSAKVTTANGDSLSVSFVNPQFAMKTGFGKVDLQVSSVRKISVAAARTGGVQEGLVMSWFVAGEKKDGDIVVPSNPDLVSMQQTRQLTIEMWIKPNSIPNSMPYHFPVLLSKGGNNPGGAYGGYELMLNAVGDNDLVFESGGCEIMTSGANGRWINNHIGEWIHVAFTMDDRTKTAKFYANGKATNDAYSNGTRNDLNFDLPNSLYLGVPDPAANANRARFDGEMRDVKLFNRALSADEIHADFAASHSD